MEELNGIRVGFGTDLHRLEANGRPLMLGGVRVPHPEGFGPVSHSDGDAVLHAVTDALLGASGLGDIGTHFPDSDPAYRDVGSSELLHRAFEMAKIHPINIDIVINCDRPRIGPHRVAIAGRIAELLGVPAERVNVKAKTFESIFPRSEAEAIFVQVALLARVARGM
jgi:2-C-methyl-D-erythritol 2,4-cyclodiphosphate synthase